MPEWTAPEDWEVDEIITATKMNTNIRDNTDYLFDWLGEIAYAQVVADAAGITTVETTIVTLNVDIPVGGRDVLLKAQLRLESSIAADVASVKIKEGGTTLMEGLKRLGAANQPETFDLEVRLDAPASGAHTYTLTVVRSAGTGTHIVRAAATYPTFLRAEAA